MSACIVAGAGYLPRYRLTGAEIARTQNTGGGRGSRALAGPDEDALTLAVEAARRLPPGALDDVHTVVFCSTSPPYLVKNNASAAAAALGLAPSAIAYDAGGSLRSAVGALRTAGPGTLVLAADVVTARPGAPNELAHGDAGVAVVTGAAPAARATVTAVAGRTDEIQDQWRTPERRWLDRSEDRFPVARYAALLGEVVDRASLEGFARVVVSAPSARVGKAAEKVLGGRGGVPRLAAVGYLGSADLLFKLVDALAAAAPGDTVLAVGVTDGVDLLEVRADRPGPEGFVAAPVEGGVVPPYLTALTWRGVVEREPPRRPEPAVVSAPAALRGAAWKYRLQASACAGCGFISTPPQAVCLRCGSAERGAPVDMTRRPAHVRTYSVDRLAYSLNPPMVAAVVGFDGGGRLEVELTDTDLTALDVGAPVRMTFRRRHSSGGVHNYVWKATVDDPAAQSTAKESA
jgi:hydroxymethylglutaryl-CoA synthase